MIWLFNYNSCFIISYILPVYLLHKKLVNFSVISDKIKLFIKWQLFIDGYRTQRSSWQQLTIIAITSKWKRICCLKGKYLWYHIIYIWYYHWVLHLLMVIYVIIILKCVEKIIWIFKFAILMHNININRSILYIIFTE